MKIEFTEQEIMLLDKAIQQMPYYLAAPLVASINRQLALPQGDTLNDEKPS